MNLLLPLGLLALLSLVVLLIIYLLKPNYQQKMISSTFVWKLSLKYRKRKIPVSKLRNILLLLCQVLVLTLAAFIIAKPAKVYERNETDGEQIVIVDASASMRAQKDGESRFDRAVSQIKDFTDEVFANGGTVTLIVAGPEAKTVAARETDAAAFDTALGDIECSYGTADVDGAMKLAENVLDANPDAAISFYTATKYKNKGKSVEIKDVSADGEWNAAILDATAELIENRYTLTVKIASYCADAELMARVTVYGADGKDQPLELPEKPMDFTNETKTLVYTNVNRGYGENSEAIILTDDYKFSSYDRIFIQLVDNAGNPIDDSIASDDEFYVYGGTMPKIKVQYASSLSNDFFIQALDAISGAFRKKGLDIDYKVVREGKTAATEGFDVYLYEHKMPELLPKDGIVFMLDPDRSVDAGFTLGAKRTIRNWEGDGESLALGMVHPVTNYVNVSEIKLSEYIYVDEASLDGYDTLMYYQSNPVVFLKNTAETKIVVMAFNINKSNLGISPFFSVLMYNFFDYFLPKTFDSPSYDVYSEVSLSARGNEIEVDTPSPDSQKLTFSEFPAKVSADKPGTYTVTQKLMTAPGAEQRTLTERFYVRVASEQSNIEREEDALNSPVRVETTDKGYDDLLIWFAAALLAFAFVEWWLQSRSGL